MAATSSKRRSFYADLDHLRKCFDQVDHGKSGFIGYTELTKLVQSMPDTECSVVPELMEKLDRDKDGKVRNLQRKKVGVASCCNAHSLLPEEVFMEICVFIR